ncbi:alpha/beta hydrolase [Georgenia sp. AZ-5]|uniref:alpha/beta hydrolase n=1 Tax=Georgenia sp. AZ-5 TaxID=3367526 RepID=UPI0037548AF5
MHASETKMFTGTRLVALSLIALLVAGLVALRLDRDEDLLAVPAGAVAGDLPLEPCEFQADSGSYPADCGSLVVAEDPADRASPLLALPVLRVRALTDTPQEPVFFLTGGPGESNVEFASQFAERYVGDRDFVAVGYRGAEGSVRLDCPEVSRASRATDILSDAFFTAVADAYGACASRFADQGIDVARYGLVQQIDDMEAARIALGYDRINLLSESAGTRTAMIYGWRHPESIHRSVMVGVNPPGRFLLDPAITDEQLARFAALCDADDACRARTPDLMATMRSTTADFPGRWGLLPIRESNIRAATLYGLLETEPTGAQSAPMMIDTWLSAADGDTSGFWFNSVLVDVLFPDLFIAGQRAAAVSIDYPAAREYFADGPGDLANLGRAATASPWAAGRYVDAWPAAVEAEPYQQVRTSEVETLLINGALDVMAPPQLASRDLMPHLPNGKEVVLPSFGHTTSFLNQQPEAGTQLVNTFFDSGAVDVSRYRPESIDFTPPSTHRQYARLVLTALLGLATIMVLSLVLVARRVRTRGRIGPVAAATFRSVLPVVLGLGGWSLGTLIVLSTVPGLLITDPLVVVPSVAVPIGLAIYFAWVHRGWPASTRRAGGAAVGAAALAGAWLGFHAATVPLALMTAIAGAVAGGNLALLVFDMRAGRSASAPPTDATVDLPDPEPATPTIGMP